MDNSNKNKSLPIDGELISTSKELDDLFDDPESFIEKQLSLPISVFDSENPKSIRLVSNLNSSVQPNILLRTPVFKPIGRRTISAAYKENDVSDVLRNLELSQTEGYDSVKIDGPELSVETDFKVWSGIVLAFTTYGIHTDEITMSFLEFAKFCNYKSNRFDANLRRQIDLSLARIRKQTLSFRRKNAVKGVHTGLLLRCEFDETTDRITLMADKTLWDLYTYDYQILVSMRVLEKLPRAEVAQCLYLFILSLPDKPVPISFSRFRERLQLKTSVKEANRAIRRGLYKLESIGFLSGSIMGRGGEYYYLIDNRNKKLRA